MSKNRIVIAGGGLAGLSAAARFAATGAEVELVDAGPRDTDAAGIDQRSTAMLQPGIATLEKAGLWSALAPHATELEGLRIMEPGDGASEPVMTEFTAAEAPGGRFGANIANGPFRSALIEALEGMPNVTLHFDTHATGYWADDDHATLMAQDKDGEPLEFTSDLLVAADGRDSMLRDQAGIGHKRWSFDQGAVVLSLRHSLPHANISTEIHAHGGPLTFVPVAGDEDQHLSAIVWMRPTDRADALMELDDDALLAELQAESRDILGELSEPSPRACWPMIGQIAHKMHGPRLALIAETAHVIPPIGAQGLNMSLDDIETLAALIEKAASRGGDIGAKMLLRRYSATQLPKTALRIGSVDGLNRLAKVTRGPIPHIRRSGLKLLNRFSPLRHLAMRTGLTGSPFGRL